MTDAPAIEVALGLPDPLRPEAARLYEAAFGPKMRSAIRDARDRLAVLERSFQGDHAFTAIAEGRLVGLAGFHTRQGSLTGGLGLRGLLAQLGLFRGLWAAAVLSLFERRPGPGELVMDGIAVHEAHRGRGIGSRLLGCIVDHARVQGYRSVRLDVIDSNADARRLYERRGFAAVREEHHPALRGLLGFRASTTMEHHLGGRAELRGRRPAHSAHDDTGIPP